MRIQKRCPKCQRKWIFRERTHRERTHREVSDTITVYGEPDCIGIDIDMDEAYNTITTYSCPCGYVFKAKNIEELYNEMKEIDSMKCKNEHCVCDITKNLVMVEDAYGERATRVLGIETDPENFSSDAYMDGDGGTKEGDFETILGDVIDEDIWFEHAFYQCNKCHREYSWEEIKEIFK